MKISEYTRKRSQFYLRIFYNPQCITLSVNEFTMELISRFSPDIVGLCPTEWKKSEQHAWLYSLWIPENKYDRSIIHDFEEWAKRCHNYIWLKLNKNIKDLFDASTLDFCICGDWNFSFDDRSRTKLGEAEYQIKYGKDVSNNNITVVKEAIESMLQCIEYVPFDTVITTMPAEVGKQNKLSWQLASCVSKALEKDFLRVTLNESKQQMKSVSVAEKIDIWSKIYNKHDFIEKLVRSDGSCELQKSCDVKDKTVIIVDDLYQSGASMWCYAKYLKEIGASNVIGIALVKSLKDSDNVSETD